VTAAALVVTGQLAFGVSGSHGRGQAAGPSTAPVAYVVSPSGTVTPISTATNKAGKAITVGKYPGAIAVTPDGRTAYVVNNGPGTVTPISTATGKAGKAITVGKNPDAIAITP
jgi:YVTN family beta-propeller protein